MGPRPAAAGGGCGEKVELDALVWWCGLGDTKAPLQLHCTGGEHVCVSGFAYMWERNGSSLPHPHLPPPPSMEAQRSTSRYLDPHPATSEGEVGSFEVSAT